MYVAELVPAFGRADARRWAAVDVVTTRLGGAQEEQVNEFVTIYRGRAAHRPGRSLQQRGREQSGAGRARERLAQKHPYDLIHAHDWLVAKAGIALEA